MASTHTRTPRGVGQGRTRPALTRRDEAILSAVASFRMIRSRDPARLLFSSASRTRAARRLRGMFRAGHLDIRLANLAEKNLHALDLPGVDRVVLSAR